MLITLTAEELSSFSPTTRAEILGLANVKPSIDMAEFPSGFDEEDFDDVVDLTTSQIEEFMEGCSEQTIAGLRVFAEHGPVIRAKLLNEAGIENYGHFQGRVTKRTRTVTKVPGAYLFTWDDWTEHSDQVGFYAITPATHRALRIYFELD